MRCALRLLIAYPLSLMFLAHSPACGGQHSLGELSGTDSTATTTGSAGPIVSTGEPSTSTSEPPGSTGSASTGEPPDPCTQFPDEASCLAAACEFVKGGTLVVDESGCHWGEPIGFCVGATGGTPSPTMYCTPGPDPVPVVFDFDPINHPEDWTGCGCGSEAPLAAGCYSPVSNNSGLDGCPVMEDHCASLTDEASCDQFQGEEGLNGCLWVETTLETAADPACNAAPPEGRCIAVRLRGAEEGCPSTEPPAWCDPTDAEKQPYFGRVGEVPPEEQLELIAHMPCEFEPLSGFDPCWDGESDLTGCGCPCIL
jgi:hypothetical protein